MKIRIIFIDPPYDKASQAAAVQADEKIILIKDPYNITMVDGGRRIVNESGTSITYEDYCIEMQKIIDDTLHQEIINTGEPCKEITIQDCKEPPNFEAVHAALSRFELRFHSTCNLIYKDCTFGGTLYVNAVANFVKSVRFSDEHVTEASDMPAESPSTSSAKPLTREELVAMSDTSDRVFFNITVDEHGKKTLSEHDIAKLASLNYVAFFQSPESPAALRRFTDDQQVSYPSLPGRLAIKDDKRFSNPSYFFKKALTTNSPQGRLLDFFSAASQQRSDYTCGPSALKMVADYYESMKRALFCGTPIGNNDAWKALSTAHEMKFAKWVKTTEEVGSEIGDMRDGLRIFDLQVVDDQAGFHADKFDEGALKAHKEILWDKFKEVLALGIPIIVNMRNHEDIGHYEVVIGIDNTNNIILAEPGRALEGKIEFEVLPKDQFIERWKNMSGQRHGRFLIVPPNECSAQAIESMLEDVPHLLNGVPNKLALERNEIQQDEGMGVTNDPSSPAPQK